MTKRLVKVLGLGLAASVALASCTGDRSPLAPSSGASSALQAQPSQSLLGGIVGGLLNTVGSLVNIVVTLVERPTALSSDVTWSFYAGPLGATSSNRTTGLSIAIPPGALDRTVRITVTAKAGKVYNYHFEPEGLQFAKPVVLTQTVQDNSLVGGVLGLLGGGSSKTIKGAYYAAPTLQYDPETGSATVNEIEPTLQYPGRVSFQIRHFSGYVLASCDQDSAFAWQ